MAKASSKTGSFILLIFIVFGLTVHMKLPGAEALVFLPCKSDEDCKAISCGDQPVYCSKGQCQCSAVSAVNKFPASAYRRTTANCKKD